MSISLPHNSVNVSQNEIFCHHTLNSNFNKLIENDKELYESYKSLFSTLNITDYDSEKTDYQYGDLVWWNCPQHDNQLYLLKCIIDNNPNQLYIPTTLTSNYDQTEYLMRIGWYNENDKLTIVNLGVKGELSAMFQNSLDEHESSEIFHPFGELNSENIDEKVLKKDMSNISEDRTAVYFPNNTYEVATNKSVIKGYYRQYDNGLLEYDIIFKFGNDEKDSGTQTIFGTSSTLSANNFTIKQSGGATTITSYDNSKYFYNASNGDIFKSTNGKTGKIQNLTIKNRNNFVNAYSATIYFPKIFRDKNYMIFTNTVMSQAEKTEDGQKNLVPSQNEIVFCNKTLESVTAINVTYPNSDKMQDENYNATNQGFSANSFHCKIIGMGE